MAVEDVFSIEGRGTVATGRIERGQVNVGDEIEIVGLENESRKTTCTGVEMFNKTLDHGQAGDNVGMLLRGVKRDEIARGQVTLLALDAVCVVPAELDLRRRVHGRERDRAPVRRRLPLRRSGRRPLPGPEQRYRR